MSKLLLICFICLAGLRAHAKEVVSNIEVQTTSGSTKVRVFQYQNAWGRNEVRLEATSLPRLGSVNPILGYGRDTDDDGRIDTYFMIDVDEGLQVSKIASRHPWGEDAIQNVLFKRYKSKLKAHVSAAYGAVFGLVLMSISNAWESEREFWRTLVDLEEFYIRLQRARANKLLTTHQYNASVDMLNAGYKKAAQDIRKATHGDYWTLVAGDVALYVTGTIALKWAAKGIKWLGQPISQLGIVQNSKAMVNKIFAKITAKIDARVQQLAHMKGIPLAMVGAQVFKKNFPMQMRGLMAKNIIFKKLIPVAWRTSNAFKKATLGWKYIAFMTALQLGTEAYARYDEVKSSDPTEFAKNVLSHPDIAANVSYMSSNAFLMTAASHGFKAKKMKFAACGFIALGNSTVSNLVVKGSTDYERVALDTGWEAIIGNAQIQIDLAALGYFERLSQKVHNPKLKLIGYAIVLVDQSAGFIGYSKATEALQASENVQMVPILVEK